MPYPTKMNSPEGENLTEVVDTGSIKKEGVNVRIEGMK